MKNKGIFCRSNPSDVLCKKGALKYLAKLTEKNLHIQEAFLREVSGCRPATLFKKRLVYRFLSVKSLNFFRTA